jgi:predicted O-methyltransferase YrrM
MKNLQELFNVIVGFENTNHVAIDAAHALFISGAVLSKKPSNILEVGIGTGYVTAHLLYSIAYNKVGKLTCIDNWNDTGGKEPPHIQSIRDAGVNVIVQYEHQFVPSCEDNTYDFVISDGDHRNSHKWIDEYLRITQNDGFMFFHDTNCKHYPNLNVIEKRVKECGLFNYHFTVSSREDEECENGLLFAINKK